MGTTRVLPFPPSLETREEVLKVIQHAGEPLAASALAKRLTGSPKIRAKELALILDECVVAGTLHQIPAKTATGKPKYWDRDARAVARAAVLEAMHNADRPLTAAELSKRLVTPLKLTQKDLAAILEESVAAGTLHAIPGATAKGKARYWTRDVLEFGRQAVVKALEAGAQSVANLKKAAAGLSAGQFEQVLQGLVAGQTVWRHPPLGKIKKELFGNRPPSPAPYLHEVGAQLSKIVAQLLAANVPHDDLRRAFVQLAEAAGISFAGDTGARAGAAPTALGARADLVELMRRIEPGAERGALVGARDLRRAAKLEKTQFDQAVLELARVGRLSLHRHDYATSLSTEERDELVHDGTGTYYVGMALRQSDR